MGHPLQTCDICPILNTSDLKSLPTPPGPDLSWDESIKRPNSKLAEKNDAREALGELCEVSKGALVVFGFKPRSYEFHPKSYSG